ncbi:hypothetical protein [Streptomonospora wellingtoniae]|uniref:Uncharacterized protein n=1 Tax=Streptomonospora wellingtoniae TaxID=3075544 RepID=A0ABU2KUB5_9ACTN|nr:hypothetical protein [Streptomonospora sp. DSM 45055]MDT0302874.1 hypothetical protein [Streptomonospora sp. DSM 45055]
MSGVVGVVAAIDTAHRSVAAAFEVARDSVREAMDASPDEFALMPPRPEEAPGE